VGGYEVFLSFLLHPQITQRKIVLSGLSLVKEAHPTYTLSTGIPVIKISDEDCLKLKDCIGTKKEVVKKASVGFLGGIFGTFLLTN